MTLPIPDIDDRGFEEILDEALSRVPVHNPEYTNFNESDPGVTMLEVFSFLTESLLYRANQIPERNRLKFLRLLGLSRRPAAVATGLVTFANRRGPFATTVLERGTEVRAGSVPFRTTHGLEVLPIESRVYYKKAVSLSGDENAEARRIYEQLNASFLPEGGDGTLSYYETTPLPPPEPGAPLPSVDLSADTPQGDQSLWLALLARPGAEVEATRSKIAGSVLTLAVVPMLADAERILFPKGEADQRRRGELQFEIPGGTGPRPEYRILESRARHPVLAEPGVVEIELPEQAGEVTPWFAPDAAEVGVGDRPPTLEETDVADRLVTWIRIRPRTESGTSNSSVSARLSVVTANGARVEQRTRVDGEYLGAGTGEPDQQVQLVNTPVLPEHLELTVGGERWTEIDDLMAAPPEVPRKDPREAPGARSRMEGDPRVFELDRASGTVRFGDGLRGARPPEGEVIQARYQYGGGDQGSVGIGAIEKGTGLPSGITVSNPVPTWGAASEETVAEAERRIAGYLKRRRRAVTESDFEAIVRSTPGLEIGRVEVLPLTYPDPGRSDVRAEGVVTVLVVPATDPDRPDAPTPDRLFLDGVCDHLDARRLVTTEVHVRGPIYVGIDVGIGIETIPGTALPPVREDVREAVRTFLSPLEGGFEGEGWPLGRAVEAGELLTVAARVDGVASVREVQVRGGGQDGRITLSTIQLPRLQSLGVQAGAAPEPGVTEPAAPDDDTGPFVPVPVVPPEC